jgi:hypothetical protein
MADEIGKLRQALALLERGRGKRYSAQMRERIRRVGRAMHAAGTGWQRIGTALGIPHETVRRLCRDDAVRDAFVAVDVAPAPAGSTGAITLVTPDGFRIEGLDLAAAHALLARLR